MLRYNGFRYGLMVDGCRRMGSYTRRADATVTGVSYGGRVPRTDPCCAACGANDEASLALGLVRFEYWKMQLDRPAGENGRRVRCYTAR